MTLLFFLGTQAREKNIYLSVKQTHSTPAIILKVPLSVSAQVWDEKKQRPANIYIKKYKKINAMLDEIKIQLTAYLSKKITKDKPLSHANLSRLVKRICIVNVPSHKKGTFVSYFESYMSFKKEMLGVSTLKRYKVFLALVKRFEGFLCKKLRVQDVGGDTIREFVRYGKDEMYCDTTIERTVNFIKTILNFAERRGVRTRVREIEGGYAKQNRREMITLTEREIVKIKKCPIPERLMPARDWLVISCYTGQRFSDFMTFCSSSIREIDGKVCIEFVQKKTFKPMILPLHPSVLNVLRRNKGCFPPPISINNYNEQIREVAKMASIEDPVSTRKREGHRSVMARLEKWRMLTSHIGRRSFATNFYGKIPTPLLMEATGHSTEIMFKRYINPIDNSRIVSLGNYFDTLYKELISKYESLATL